MLKWKLNLFLPAARGAIRDSIKNLGLAFFGLEGQVRVSRRDYSLLLPSERYKRLSTHTRSSTPNAFVSAAAVTGVLVVNLLVADGVE